MKVRIDEKLCVNCGACTDTCPDVFEMEGDAVTIKVDNIRPETEAAVKAAAEICPVDAIIVE